MMNGYYNYKNGTITHYELNPQSEKTLFKDAINDRLVVDNETKMIGCEIGVLNGETSAFFLNEFPELTLLGIDPLIPDSMEASLIGSIEIIERNVAIHKDRWKLLMDYSYRVHNIFQENYFDFIFIDGDHTYEAVSQDFELYLSKVKKGGLVFMHDSRMNRGGANFHVGSSKFADHIIANDTRVNLLGEAFSLTAFIKN
jgi:hypothetical protein